MIKVFLVDDHEMVRDGIRFFLKDYSEISILGEAASPSEAYAFLSKQTEVEIVIMDVDMPGMGGIRLCSLLAEKYKIIALSSSRCHDTIRAMIEAGAKGYINKSTGRTDLYTALIKVHQNEMYFSGEVDSKLIKELEAFVSGNIAEIELSERELDVLKLIALGFSNREIADQLFLSPRTIDNHRANMLKKTGAKNLIHLVKMATDAKWI